MKTIRQIKKAVRSLNLEKFIAALVLMVTSLTTITPVANAAFFGWGADNMAYLAEQMRSVSFDQLYSDVTSPSSSNAVQDLDMKAQAATAQNTPVVRKASAPATSTAVASSTMIVEASGYSSTPDQTDDSPFITAMGSRVRDGIIAANFLPFGTKIRIPDVYGNKIFVVEDRMNKRYWKTIDVWFADRQTALQFGRRNVRIEIL